MSFPVKVKDIHKIEKNNSINISVFGYENKELCIKNVVKKNDYLLLIEQKQNKHCVLTKDFNTVMYDHNL